MQPRSSIIARYPLVTYFVLAYAISWALVLLVPVSLAFALLALFGPTAAALIVLWLTEGKAGIAALFRRIVLWRASLVWYLAAIGVPLLVYVAVKFLHSLISDTPFEVASGTPIPLLLTLAVLVIGEEIGWRGYALPRLQARNNSLVSSLILGVLWAGWHLANGTIKGLEYYWSGFPAFLFFVVAQTLIFTWLANHTKNSVFLAWILHASVNVFGSLFFVGEQVTQWWLAGAGFAIVALVVILVQGVNLGRSPTAQAESTFMSQQRTS